MMRLPVWLQKKISTSTHVHAMKRAMRQRGLHTVCEEAKCPNLGECFSRRTATFMIMGNICTRHCGFCAVKNGAPKPLDQDEPRRIAKQVQDMGLAHAVITSVTRDDLADGGAAHFAETITEIRKRCPKTTIEVLTPDFNGNEKFIKIVCDAHPHIFNHNVETVERLTPMVRNKASYRRSLEVLRVARTFLPLCKGESEGVDLDLPPLTPPPRQSSGHAYKGGELIKSGLMVGLGESEEEVTATLRNLKEAGCDIITIGQYLRPSKGAIPVAEYIYPDQFKKYQLIGEEIGIKHMFCDPFVRSSYMAHEILRK